MDPLKPLKKTLIIRKCSGKFFLFHCCSIPELRLGHIQVEALGLGCYTGEAYGIWKFKVLAEEGGEKIELSDSPSSAVDDDYQDFSASD